MLERFWAAEYLFINFNQFEILFFIHKSQGK